MRLSGPAWTASLALDRLGMGWIGRWPDHLVAGDRLRAQVEAILRTWGMAEEHIAITLEHLLYADRHGIDSHGCGMLLAYQRDLARGFLTMRPNIQTIRETSTTALIDGGGGLGHVPSDAAMRLAIGKAREAGVGIVAVRNSGHFGAAGSYVSLAAREGLLGAAVTNTALPSVVPTFGLQAMLGTNPIAFAAPARRNHPFLLDMATSTAALGRLTTAWRRGRSIPEGWALTREGRPETNPRRAVLGRRLTPLGSSRKMGGHKGYGLAAMVEVLTGVLPGLPHPGRAPGARGPIGHCFAAVDPGRFCGPDEFKDGMDDLMDSLRACPPANGAEPVLVAGDPEYEAASRRDRHGISIPRAVVEDIRAICRDSGAEFLLDTRP